MPKTPASALILGLAGLIPFLWAALGHLMPQLSDWTVSILGQRFAASHMLIAYGTVILCFMSGVLWGFATEAFGTAATKAYALSVVPALWAFFAIGGGETRATSAVLVGFLLVFACDLQFSAWGLTPSWWVKLRAMLTGIVVLCLLIGFIL